MRSPGAALARAETCRRYLRAAHGPAADGHGALAALGPLRRSSRFMNQEKRNRGSGNDEMDGTAARGAGRSAGKRSIKAGEDYEFESHETRMEPAGSGATWPKPASRGSAGMHEANGMTAFFLLRSCFPDSSCRRGGCAGESQPWPSISSLWGPHPQRTMWAYLHNRRS